MGNSRSAAKAFLVAAIIGLLVGGLCFAALRAHNSVKPEVKAGDFERALRDGRDILAGQDPYRYPPGPYAIPYPLLAYGIVRSGEEWRLAMLLSWSFAYAFLWVQWTPLICALWFLPGVAVAALVKPHIALPVLLAGRSPREWKWFIAPAVLLLVSLIVYPAWPWVWIKQTATYQGILPPILSLPLGPLVLMALANWRDRRAWLIVMLAAMPQRMVYDQLPLMLAAENRKHLWLLIGMSWINCAIFFRSDGWGAVPMGWQNFIVATLYLPAVAVVAWPKLKEFLPAARAPRLIPSPAPRTASDNSVSADDSLLRRR